MNDCINSGPVTRKHAVDSHWVTAKVRVIKDKVQVDPFYPRQEPQNLFSFISIICTDPSEQRGEMEGKGSNLPLWLGAG